MGKMTFITILILFLSLATSAPSKAVTLDLGGQGTNTTNDFSHLFDIDTLSGNWGSEGGPRRPPTPPTYDYAYYCSIEVSDQKLYGMHDDSYIVIARAFFKFDKSTNFVKGSELQWQVFHHNRDIRWKKSGEKNPYPTDDFNVRVIVDATSSAFGGTAEDDLVYLHLYIQQPVSDETDVHFRKETIRPFKSNWLSGELHSAISSTNPKINSLTMQVTCKK